MTDKAPTARELDVLAAWFKSRSNFDTAKELGIAEQTVKNTLSIFRFREQVDGTIALVKLYWKDVAIRTGGERSYRRMRYQVDGEYADKQRRIAREAMRKMRAVHAGRRNEIYAQLQESQAGRCAICGREERAIVTKNGRARRLSIDHDHDSGEIRGLLCLQCNVMLGNANDDPERLREALRYLEKHAKGASHNVPEEAA